LNIIRKNVLYLQRQTNKNNCKHTKKQLNNKKSLASQTGAGEVGGNAVSRKRDSGQG
jgi:hypothetical protein